MSDFDIRVEYGAFPTILMKDVKSPRLMREAAVEAINFAFPVVERVLRENTPVGTGLAGTLIQYDPPSASDPEPHGFVGYGEPASNYMLFVEVGTVAHWAPIAPLALWAGRKFGDARLGWRARYGIAMRGTKAQNFVRRTQEEVMAPVSQMMADKLGEFLNSPLSKLRNLLGV